MKIFSSFIYILFFFPFFPPSLLPTVLAAWSISAAGASQGSYSCCLHSPFLLNPTSAVQISNFPKANSSSSCFTNCSINAASSPFCSSSQRDSGFSCPSLASHRGILCLDPPWGPGRLQFSNGAGHFNFELMGTCLWIPSPRNVCCSNTAWCTGMRGGDHA